MAKKVVVKNMKKPSHLKVVKSHIPDVMKLDDLTRLKLLRYDAEMKSAQSQANMQTTALNAYIKQIDPQGRMLQLQNEVIACRTAYENHSKAYAQLCEEVGKQFKIKMQEYAFDDETGVLTPLNIPTAEAVGGPKKGA